MDSPRARWKLDEARFFLGFLDDREDKLFEREPRAFNFFLSAFLNATYSVTEMVKIDLTQQLRKQGQKGTGGALAANFLAEWEPSLGAKDREIWEWMPRQRGAEVQREGVISFRQTRSLNR
jgi:hypothetical protein